MTQGSKSQYPGLPGFNPDNLQPWILAVNISMTILATITVVLRLASRRIRKQQLWWDDWMIIFSQIWLYITLALSFALYVGGVGIHADLLPPENPVFVAKWLVVCETMYVWNLVWTKLSVLLMYFRIFDFPLFRKMTYYIAGLVIAWVICITFLFIFICVPVQKLWYPSLPGHCISQVGTWIANAIATIFTDLAILLMPIPQIWRLQLRTTEKMGLTVAFSLGFFVVFASAYRTSVLFTYNHTDPTYTLAPTLGWTGIELAAGIISACLPTLLPVLRLFARRIGIKRNFLSPRNRGTTGASPSSGKQSNGSSRPSNPILTVGGQSTRRPSENHFYRLDEDTESDGSIPTDMELGAVQPMDPLGSLRPDTKGFKHTVRSYTTQTGPNGASNEIPLHGIRVQTEFEHSTITMR
ncbi:Wortmanamides biosynthesis cluster C-like protein [Cladobotryum mycophilum]|uniref:Wortmanamides biosynthesis cluster C-like protein n=1 Tax=Cladobotryum mycophilum TaxID=491253 RepID=A0ABR0SIW3_9HYPO